MILEKAVLEQQGISHYEIIKNFFSRRNNVCLVRGQHMNGTGFKFVYKEYLTGDIGREYEYLQRLNGLPVPEVLARGDNSLALSYISGHTMLERLEQAEKDGEQFESCIDAFIEFLDSFYTALQGHIYGDVNMRNFIVTDKGICGVDLEEAGAGEVYTDIGRAAAFLLTYNPSYTDYKKRLSEYLIDIGSVRFGFKRNFAQEALESELAAMEIRRKEKQYKQVGISTDQANLL